MCDAMARLVLNSQWGPGLIAGMELNSGKRIKISEFSGWMVYYNVILNNCPKT